MAMMAMTGMPRLRPDLSPTLEGEPELSASPLGFVLPGSPVPAVSRGGVEVAVLLPLLERVVDWLDVVIAGLVVAVRKAIAIEGMPVKVVSVTPMMVCAVPSLMTMLHHCSSSCIASITVSGTAELMVSVRLVDSLRRVIRGARARLLL